MDQRLSFHVQFAAFAPVKVDQPLRVQQKFRAGRFAPSPSLAVGKVWNKRLVLRAQMVAHL
jgi:hypothetical protein